ncbi:crotonase/enoyl-CoA hydratase family protein [Dokdonella soli]|uniref:Crotonase/enoyl-CoA hydratase family protein n=1 Tax=Dokdonella soli TaxID=529810 RepID=A0ABN1IB63_9GAMM
MTAVEMLHRNHDYRLLRTIEDPVANAHWCFMHAHRLPRDTGYRACFSVALMKEMRDFLKRTSDHLTLSSTNADANLTHVVMASDANVYNLGGDLELFCRLIRERNREHLLAYARLCVEGVLEIHAGLNRNVHTVALVQGDALGGGLELALSCQTVVAESGVGMGFPEVLFDLFPGMGAYSFLRQRVSPRFAEEMMLNGTIYSSDELHRLGLVDVLVPKGEGVQAVHNLIRRNQRIPHARTALNRLRQIGNAVTLAELMQITEIWVDTAMQLGEKSLRTMERLVRAQQKRPAAVEDTDAAVAPIANVAAR